MTALAETTVLSYSCAFHDVAKVPDLRAFTYIARSISYSGFVDIICSH
jgi:hypothetical protein